MFENQKIKSKDYYIFSVLTELLDRVHESQHEDQSFLLKKKVKQKKKLQKIDIPSFVDKTVPFADDQAFENF